MLFRGAIAEIRELKGNYLSGEAKNPLGEA